jgi:formate C-acetyltransferase
VNKNTPDDLLELSLKSILTGIGAPLFANDDVVIPQLIEFGIKEDDALTYTTSACWEPLIGGKSSSLNNRTVLNFLKAFDNMISRDNLSKIGCFDELIERYLFYLRRNIQAIKRVLAPHRFEYDPLLSMFIQGCKESHKDISQGGALYHNVGITSVAMGNLINSLINIKELVFEKKVYSLYDVRKILINNYEGYEELQTQLRDKDSYYGSDTEESIELVKRIMQVVSEEIDDFVDYQNGKMKIGLSGSAYMDIGRGFGASFDGRGAGEGFIVHISNEDNNGYTEIVNFASEMQYEKNLFNGNVIDLMVNPVFMTDNWNKFLMYLKLSIQRGFFELQMNVVSSEILIAAKNNPELYPNLIVRVWGFSSYFNDLPEEYKNLLIIRAKKV